MCARYHSVLDAARLKQFFKIGGLRDIMAAKDEVFPGYAAPFIRRPPERESGEADRLREGHELPEGQQPVPSPSSRSPSK